MNDVLGWAVFVAIALIGIASAVAASIWLWRLLRRHNVGVIPAALVTAVGAVLAFWGLWIVFDLYMIVAAVVKLIGRMTGGNQRPMRQSG